MTQEAILTRESTNADNLKNVIADIKKRSTHRSGTPRHSRA